MSGTLFNRYGAAWHTLPSGKRIAINDLTKFAVIPREFKEDSRYYLRYQVQDGERVDQIAQRVYGDENLWWMVLLFNDIQDPYTQWYMSDATLDEYITRKYPRVNVDSVMYYVDDLGNVVSPLGLMCLGGRQSVAGVIHENALRGVTYRQHEEQINEKRRDIKIPDPDRIGLIMADLERIFENG